MPKICTPIQLKTQKSVIARLIELNGKTDVAEIWLDHIKDPDVRTLLKNTSIPVLVVCKRADEKGMFKGSFDAMAKQLTDAGINGARYIDIPFKMPRNLSTKIVQKTPEVVHIISFHNFKKTQSISVLYKKALNMQGIGADIVKIATKANKLSDTINLILLAKMLQEAGIKHIVIGMGKKGMLTRIITPHLGGTMMFAPLSIASSSALGQLTVRELKKAWSLIQSS